MIPVALHVPVALCCCAYYRGDVARNAGFLGYPDSAQPLLAWASRLLSSDNVIARNRIDPTHWEEVMNQIREAAARDDIIALGEYLRLAAATTRP